VKLFLSNIPPAGTAHVPSEIKISHPEVAASIAP